MGSFYYGYMIFQLPGGILALRLGGVRLFGIGVCVASALTLLTPLAARISPVMLIILRILEGLALVSQRFTTCQLEQLNECEIVSWTNLHHWIIPVIIIVVRILEGSLLYVNFLLLGNWSHWMSLRL